jgi:hypothetical protein
VGVGWLAPTEPPAEEARLERERFLAAVPERHLEGEAVEQDGEAREVSERSVEEEVAAEVAVYVSTHPGAGVMEVMGALTLPPSARAVVEEVVSVGRGGAGEKETTA